MDGYMGSCSKLTRLCFFQSVQNKSGETYNSERLQLWWRLCQGLAVGDMLEL